MLGKSTSNMSLEDLQKAVMGGNPAIEPYQALAAIEKMVKGEKAKAAQMAQQPRPQGMVAQRTMAEAAALRNPYMAAGLGAAPVPSPVSFQGAEAPQQQAPQGMAGGGMVAFAAGGGVNPYDSGFEALSDDDRIAALQKYKTALGANNSELMAPLEAQQAKYAQEAEKTKKGGLGDALLAAGLGTLAGKSQYAMQNIGEGGLKGLAAYQDSQKGAQAAQDRMLQSQADMAKSRIALEKGDETTAAALQNQARQEAQAAGQFKLQGQYYAGSNAAQMAAANNRGLGAGFGADKQRLAELKALQASLQTQLDVKKNPELMLNKNAAKKAELKSQLDQVNASIASMSGVGTMAANTPGAGAAGGQNVYNFNDITNPH
jgi:hypothetical protein